MSLITQVTQKVFNLDIIERGDLVYARHSSWEAGRGGFATSISEREITVQYYPGIGSVTNYFTISAQDISQWQIRWSKDLMTIEGNMGDG